MVPLSKLNNREKGTQTMKPRTLNPITFNPKGLLYPILLVKELAILIVVYLL